MNIRLYIAWSSIVNLRLWWNINPKHKNFDFIMMKKERKKMKYFLEVVQLWIATDFRDLFWKVCGKHGNYTRCTYKLETAFKREYLNKFLIHNNRCLLPIQALTANSCPLRKVRTHFLASAYIRGSVISSPREVHQ